MLKIHHEGLKVIRAGRAIPWLVIALVALGGGCVSTRRRPSAAARVVAGVPFFPQQPHQCGPAALASLVGFFGHPATPDRIAAEIYEPTAAGTSTASMLAYGALHQLPLHVARGTIDAVYAEIDAGRPLIALHRQSLPWSDFHYVVVTGYEPSDGTLYGYSGHDAHAQWSRKGFMRRWESADNWLLTWADGEAGFAAAADRRARAEDQPQPDQAE